MRSCRSRPPGRQHGGGGRRGDGAAETETPRLAARRNVPRLADRRHHTHLPRTPQTALACGIYSASAWLLFGTSAVYHRGTWGPRGKAVLRRLDHANIFVIIAGTYTPLTVLLIPQHRRAVLLGLVWTGALAGVAFRVLWVGAPRWLYTPCYLALGWSAVFLLPDFMHVGGVAVVTLIVVGGVLYTAGAVVYGTKRPDPSPRWFGFHEVFHTFTLAAFTTHYAAIALATVYASGGQQRPADRCPWVRPGRPSRGER